MAGDVRQSHVDLWMQHMRRGDFEAAWRVSDALLGSHAGVPCWHRPRHLQYVWDGTPLDGKRVLVRCYHGLGDTIQFIRYAPMVKAVAAEVIVWVQPRLIPLLSMMRGVDRLLPLHDGTPEVDYDVDVEIMELPHVFRTTLETLPAEVPYLDVDAKPRPRDGTLAVGLVWRAGPWDDRRSIPFHRLASWAELPRVEWHILQWNAEDAGWSEGFGIKSGGDDILEDARRIRSLDLMVSVDTMPAHLAGALGVPVWNLLHAGTGWRWMERQDRSPWYPTMRLFRQNESGQWGPVIAQVTAELKKLSGATF